VQHRRHSLEGNDQQEHENEVTTDSGKHERSLEMRFDAGK
jgi:hypothetical protein